MCRDRDIPGSSHAECVRLIDTANLWFHNIVRIRGVLLQSDGSDVSAGTGQHRFEVRHSREEVPRDEVLIEQCIICSFDCVRDYLGRPSVVIEL